VTVAGPYRQMVNSPSSVSGVKGGVRFIAQSGRTRAGPIKWHRRTLPADRRRLVPGRKRDQVWRSSSVCDVICTCNGLSDLRGFESARRDKGRHVGILEVKIGQNIVADARNLPGVSLDTVCTVSTWVRTGMCPRFQIALVILGLDQGPLGFRPLIIATVK